MKKLLLWFLFPFLPLLLSSCASVTVETSDCKATYISVFKNVDAAQFSVCGGSADVVESSVNLDSLKAMLTALAAGLK